MTQVLRDTSADIENTFTRGDDPSDPDNNDVSVTVYGADGVEQDSGTATRLDIGVYTYSLAAPSDVDRLTVEWAVEFDGSPHTVQSTVDVIGGFYVSLYELRQMRSLDDATRHPNESLQRVRQDAEATFERATGVAWQPRYGQHEAHDVSGRVFLPNLHVRKVLWAHADGEALDVADLTVRDTGLVTGLPDEEHSLEIGYEHGYEVIPGDLRERFRDYVRYLAVEAKSDLPDRATAMVADGVSFRIATPSRENPTGLPAIDAVLSDYDERIVGFA